MSLRAKEIMRRMNFPYYFSSHKTVCRTKYQQEGTLPVYISASYLELRSQFYEAWQGFNCINVSIHIIFSQKSWLDLVGQEADGFFLMLSCLSSFRKKKKQKNLYQIKPFWRFLTHALYLPCAYTRLLNIDENLCYRL